MSNTNYENVKNSRQRLKTRLLFVMGEKCAICGYHKCNTALEFHHLDPVEKEFTLGANTNISTEKALEEMQKCVLLCANCHRELHAGLILENLTSSYSQERAEEVLMELNKIKHGELHYCQRCGVIVSESRATHCPKCAGFIRRVCEHPDRETLKNLIRTMPFTQIGKQYGVADNTIKKWCKQENLPYRKQDINLLSDEEWQNI